MIARCGVAGRCVDRRRDADFRQSVWATRRVQLASRLAPHFAGGRGRRPIPSGGWCKKASRPAESSGDGLSLYDETEAWQAQFGEVLETS